MQTENHQRPTANSQQLIIKFFLTFMQSLGVPFQAEMIPYKPDADNAAEGKSRIKLQYSVIPEILTNQEKE
jgi:hypothetical protein